MWSLVLHGWKRPRYIQYNTIHYIEEGHNGRDGKARREIVLARKDCLARGAGNTSLFTKCSVVSRRRVWWRCDQNMYLSACVFLYTHNENIKYKHNESNEERRGNNNEERR